MKQRQAVRIHRPVTTKDRIQPRHAPWFGVADDWLEPQPAPHADEAAPQVMSGRFDHQFSQIASASPRTTTFTPPPAPMLQLTPASSTVPEIQRDENEQSAEGEAEEAGQLSNERFRGISRLQQIAGGGRPLRRGDSRQPVQAVQRALLDIGYSLLRFHDDGDYGNETADAIRQFRADRQIPGDDMDSTALLVLDRVAPPPGAAAEHYVDYDRLLADNRLDFAVGVGFDEGGAHTGKAETLRAWLTEHQFSGGPGANPGIERYTARKSLTYPTAGGSNRTRDIQVNFTMITPGIGASQAFLDALNNAEVTVYTGHARGGLGPDFDDKHSSAEQVNIGADSSRHSQRGSNVRTPRDPYWRSVARERNNDFERMARNGEWNTQRYRVWFFNGCTTLNYMDEIRNGVLPPEITRGNLDVFGTAHSVPTASGIHTTLMLIEGILNSQTMEQMVAAMQTRGEADMAAIGATAAEMREFREGAYFREGAGDNPTARQQQPPVQPKLAIGARDDVYEQEADAVADHVMRKPMPETGSMEAPIVRRLPASSDNAPETADIDADVAAMRGGGQPLHDDTRSFMEQRMGHDFAQVRVHTDSRAATAARSINALAFTTGNDIAFAPGQYQPGSDEGQRLLAHELTHVVQQRSAPMLAQRQEAPAEAPAAEEQAEPAAEAEPAITPPVTLTNTRFTPHTALRAIAEGRRNLSRGDNGRPVKAVQTALLDIGYSLLRFHDDGELGNETREAVRLFRRDQRLADGEEVDYTVLAVLDRVAPPPGNATEHFVDYERLLADGRLDFSISIGYDEGQAHVRIAESARTWLEGQGFTLASGTPDEGNEQYQMRRDITYPNAQGQQVTRNALVTLRLITPGAGAARRFIQTMNDSEIMSYVGHARGGLGPDFDDKHSAQENVVLGAHSSQHDQRGTGVTTPRDPYWREVESNQTNTLEEQTAAGAWDENRYRVWLFYACTSQNFQDELRSSLLPPAMNDRRNLDIFGTNKAVPVSGGITPVIAMIEGILNAQTMEQIVRSMQANIEAALRAHPEATSQQIQQALRTFGDAFYREGAGDNPAAQPAAQPAATE